MKTKVNPKVNWPVTILLILGLITVIFPLYMTIVIAFKQPSEMTNSISGILSLPKSWSLSNFAEAMRVTDFWHSLFNSILITVLTVVISIVVHSLIGYAIGRNKGHSKFYNFVYLYIVSGMFVPFAILMMPLVKQTAHADECPSLLRLSGKYTDGTGRSSLCGRCDNMADLLENHFPDHEANACNRCGPDSTRNMERCYDSACHYVRFRYDNPPTGTDDIPDAVRNQF